MLLPIRFLVGESNVRVGVVVFSDTARIAIPLDMYSDKSSLFAGVNHLAFLDGPTNLAEGFSLLNSQVSQDNNLFIIDTNCDSFASVVCKTRYQVSFQ